MKNDLFVKNGIIIPEHELTITSSRAGGPGGQHVNKTDTRITVRWNVNNTTTLSPEQKERVLQNLHTQLSTEGDLIIHNNESRSQFQNKKMALAQLAKVVAKALYIPKKRIATKIPKTIKEARLQSKTKRSAIKKLRSKKIYTD